jgi:hypothetical protein
VQNNNINTVVLAISYSYHFKWGLFYTVPRFAGTFLVDNMGSIDLLSLEEALNNPILENNLLSIQQRGIEPVFYSQ